MFLIKELGLCFLSTWFLLIFINKNEGGVVNLNPPKSFEQMYRLTQQMNAIRNQAQKDTFAWSRFVQFGDNIKVGSSDEDGLNDHDDIYDDDPEVRPRLFQGDIALDLQMYKYWRVGLNWNAYPERMWPNRTVPYAISPLYEPEDQVNCTLYLAICNYMEMYRIS